MPLSDTPRRASAAGERAGAGMVPVDARIGQWSLVGIVLLGAALRLWGLTFGLPHTESRPDEEFIVAQALRFFDGDLNPHFFEWPSLSLYAAHALLRVAYVFGHVSGRYADVAAFVASVTDRPAWVYIALRLASAACGVLTLVVIYRLARAMFDRLTAAVAMFFLAVAYLHVRDSHFGVLDVPLTLFVASTILLLWQAVSRAYGTRWFALAGAFAGVATSLKYNAAALLATAAVAAIVLGTERRSARPWWDGSVGFAAFTLAWAVCALAGTPYAILDHSAFVDGFAAQWTHLFAGHGVIVPNAWVHHLDFSLRYGLGLPLLITALAGAAALIVVSPTRAGLLLAFPVSYYLAIGSGHTAFVRYALPLVPFLCVTAAFAVTRLVVFAKLTRPPVIVAVVSMTTVVLSLASVENVIRLDRLLTMTDTRVLAADWLGRHMAPHDSLYESGRDWAQPRFAWSPAEHDYRLVIFNEAREQFTLRSGDLIDPDWIVIAESPVEFYTRVPAGARTALATGYRLVQRFTAVKDPEPQDWFDRQDAFFLPYAHLENRQRPGPDLSIYQRTERR